MFYEQLNVQLECGVLAKVHVHVHVYVCVYVCVVTVCATLSGANIRQQRKLALVPT